MSETHDAAQEVLRLEGLRKSYNVGKPTEVEVLHEGYPFAYLRGGGSRLVVVNPRREPASVALPDGWADARPLEVEGVALSADGARADGFGYGVFARS